MILELIIILKNDGASLPVDANIDFGKISFGGVEYLFNTPCEIKGNVRNIGGVLRFCADVSGKATVPCGSCTSPLEISDNYNIDETLTSST